MASRHLDKLVRSFISGSSDPRGPFDPFADTQDPTYLSFKIDFFPDGGLSMPDDAYSSGGLFRSSFGGNNTILSYSFADSAGDYLARIGAPTRQAELEIFIALIRDIQDKAPWYFQSIAGLADLYKIDPAINYRGKDKVLTVECLESLDLRMTLLADLYRNIAFDFENMREVLPYNLRTFSMNIHVLEFRKFNTTFGIIADQLANPSRTTAGQDRQGEKLDSQSRNVFNNAKTALFQGALNNINALGNTLNSALGGMFSNLGDQAGADNVGQNIKEAFEAISVQTFVLKDCEFDFYSEAPGYLDTVSVKDIPEATTRFKIKVGKIQKSGTYSFHDYIISEYTRKTQINLGPLNVDPSPAYFESSALQQRGSKNDFRNLSQAIFPTESQADAYKKQLSESDRLRRKPLERALGSILGNVATTVNKEILNALGKKTGGLVGNAPLGNVYGDPSFLKKATESLNDFFTPGNQLTTRQQSAVTPPSETLKNIHFEALNADRTLIKKNIYQGPAVPIEKLANGKQNIGFDKLPVGTLPKENVFPPPTAPVVLVKENVFPPPTSAPVLSKENVYKQTPPLPKSDLGKTNVFE